MTEMSLQEYWDQLNKHDWTYMMSDSHRVYLEGASEAGRLKEIAKGKPEFEAMYRGFYEHVWSGPHMGKDQKPKPERPS